MSEKINKTQNELIETISTLIDTSMHSARYDKTIQATIITCVDPSIGKYSISYQDSILTAYSTSTDIEYSDNTLVYVLIPENDMSSNKTIIGAVDKLGLDYIIYANSEDDYDKVGINCIRSSKEFGISAKEIAEDSEKILYVNDGTQKTYDIDFDTDALTQYIKEKESNFFLIGAKFKTDLDEAQKRGGDYGIIFTLSFETMSGGFEEKSYVLNTKQMIGTPYNFSYFQRQYQIFEIIGARFNRVERVSIFSRDFLEIDDKERIFVKDIEFYALNRLTNSEVNGCSVNFITTEGTYFYKNESKDKLPISAELRAKGKRVADISKIEFYWFVEDATIGPKSDGYNVKGGKGWRCLNDFTIQSERKNEKGEIIKDILWSPAENKFNISKDLISNKETKIKCVAYYDKNLYYKEIIFTNLDAYSYELLSIVGLSSEQRKQLAEQKFEGSFEEKTIFYSDNQDMTTFIYCKIKDSNGKEISNLDDYYFEWRVEDYLGNLFDIEKKTDIRFPSLENKFKNETAFQQELEQWEKDYSKEFSYKRSVWNLNLKKITNQSTYRCAIFKSIKGKKEQVGSTSISIIKKLENENGNVTYIKNGEQSFKYSSDGTSPNHESKEVPQTILPLEIVAYDEQGHVLPEEALKNLQVKWTIPYENTLIEKKIVADQHHYTDNSVDKTRTFTQHGYKFDFNIKNTYDANSTNNDIIATIISSDRKQSDIILKTNFTFLKDGDNGTNGSEYSCKIFPINDNKQIISDYDINTISLNGKNGYQLFTAKLYKAGEEVPSNEVTYDWKILHNIYMKDEIQDYAVEDSSFIKVESFTENDITENNAEDENRVISLNSQYVSVSGQYEEAISDLNNFSVSNILRCELTTIDEDSGKKKSVFCTMPIIVKDIVDETYTIDLKKNSGFRYVQYTSDGVNPSYVANNPFELIVKRKGIDISSSLQADGKVIFYNWGVAGMTADSSASFSQSNNLILPKAETALSMSSNKFLPTPADRYTGLCVSNMVYCELYEINAENAKEYLVHISNKDYEITSTFDSTSQYDFKNLTGKVKDILVEGDRGKLIGKIFIPIHFYLNKNGLSQFNDWDGNSIQLSEEGGYILSPQMGAGRKNEDNTFTGVLMGEVKDPRRETADIGLLGYNNSIRTFFLDAESGGAIFGRGKYIDEDNNRLMGGRILIDPSAGAKLYSENYYTPDAYKDNGFLLDFVDWNNDIESSQFTNGQGMLIDLERPEIRFGSGNFSVDSNGHLIALGGGQIGGWAIGYKSLYSKDLLFDNNRQVWTINETETLQDAFVGLNSTGEISFEDSSEGIYDETREYRAGEIVRQNFTQEIKYYSGMSKQNKETPRSLPSASISIINGIDYRIQGNGNILITGVSNATGIAKRYLYDGMRYIISNNVIYAYVHKTSTAASISSNGRSVRILDTGSKTHPREDFSTAYESWLNSEETDLFIRYKLEKDETIDIIYDRFSDNNNFPFRKEIKDLDTENLYYYYCIKNCTNVSLEDTNYWEPIPLGEIEADMSIKSTNEKIPISFWAGKKEFFITNTGLVRGKEIYLKNGNEQYLSIGLLGETENNIIGIYANKKKVMIDSGDTSTTGFVLSGNGIAFGPSKEIDEWIEKPKNIIDKEVVRASYGLTLNNKVKENYGSFLYVDHGRLGSSTAGFQLKENGFFFKKTQFNGGCIETVDGEVKVKQGVAISTDGIGLGEDGAKGFQISNEGTGYVGGWRVIGIKEKNGPISGMYFASNDDTTPNSHRIVLDGNSQIPRISSGRVVDIEDKDKQWALTIENVIDGKYSAQFKKVHISGGRIQSDAIQTEDIPSIINKIGPYIAAWLNLNVSYTTTGLQTESISVPSYKSGSGNTIYVPTAGSPGTMIIDTITIGKEGSTANVKLGYNSVNLPGGIEKSNDTTKNFVTGTGGNGSLVTAIKFATSGTVNI